MMLPCDFSEAFTLSTSMAVILPRRTSHRVGDGTVPVEASAPGPAGVLSRK
jgi:hypothetical protein